MKKSRYNISKVQSKNNLPFHLLLLADETIEAIGKYIYDSDVYVVNTTNIYNQLRWLPYTKGTIKKLKLKILLFQKRYKVEELEAI